MNNTNIICILKNVIFVAIFVGGLYFYVKYSSHPSTEGMETAKGEQRCPNILIQKGAKYYLYNSNITKVPGVNPIMFNNLEEYVEFLDWQRGAGIRCPVLYVQNTYNAQGERVYKIRPSAIELQGGLMPSLPNKPAIPYIAEANAQATNSDVDENMLHNSGDVSPDPMDPNWGGVEYTENLVKSGYYAGNEVSINVP